VKIKLDHGISHDLRITLAELGHDVDTALAEGLSSADDITIAGAARNANRMLFVLDHWFADIRDNPPGDHPGIIRFRLPVHSPGLVKSFVEQFAHDHNLDDMVGCVVVVEPGRVRIRRPSSTE